MPKYIAEIYKQHLLHNEQLIFLILYFTGKECSFIKKYLIGK